MNAKNYIYTILLVFFILENLICQPTTWYKEYGYPSGSEWGKGVVQINDGGYLVFGFRAFFAVILKTDSLGNLIWRKAYSPSNGKAAIYAFDKTFDGGYIMAGADWEYNNPNKIYLLKIDEDGNKLWDKSLAKEGSWFARSIKQISTGGFIIADERYLIKTNDSGDTLWTQRILEFASSVCETSDSGFAITGRSNQGVFLIKTDSNGNELWVRYFSEYKSHSIQRTIDGGFVLAGEASFSADEKFVLIIKTDKDGNQEFKKYFAIDKSFGRHVIQLSDSGYAVTGYNTRSLYSEFEIYVLRLDKFGNKVWEKNYIPANHYVDGYYIQQTNDGGFIVTGNTNFDPPSDQIFLLKIDSDGILTNIKSSKNNYVNNYNLSQNYPNPFNPSTTISYQIPERGFVTLKIYDVLGNQVATLVNEEKPAGSYQVKFDGLNLSSGIYFYRMRAVDPETSSGQGFVETKKLILLK